MIDPEKLTSRKEQAEEIEEEEEEIQEERKMPETNAGRRERRKITGQVENPLSLSLSLSRAENCFQNKAKEFFFKKKAKQCIQKKLTLPKIGQKCEFALIPSLTESFARSTDPPSVQYLSNKTVRKKGFDKDKRKFDEELFRAYFLYGQVKKDTHR